MRILLVLTISVLASLPSFSQKDDRLVQLSGVLVSADSLDLVSYASIIDKTTRKGTMADYYGYFSFVTKPGDTILFNSFGFKSSSVHSYGSTRI